MYRGNTVVGSDSDSNDDATTAYTEVGNTDIIDGYNYKATSSHGASNYYGYSVIDSQEITVNDIIIIKPGDKIPLDGLVIAGESSVNQAPITGESIPVDKQFGDHVYAGTINEHGSLEIKVTKLVEDTTISKIIHLVEEAQEQKAPTEAFVDKFARIYTPIVFILALAVMFLPDLLCSLSSISL